MRSGFVYILQNQLYGAYVVKIGISRRKPNVRAREIYSAGSGVPVPFDIAVSFSVMDCVQAEKSIHRRLRSFRINNRREFFYASPAVASMVAMEECAAINAKLGAAPPDVLHFPSQAYRSGLDGVTSCLSSDVEKGQVEKILISRLRSSSVGTGELSLEQLDRIRIVSMMLENIFPGAAEEWQEDFSRDKNPENEIRIWEEFAKAYLSVEESEFSTVAQRNEAFALLLARTSNSREKVISEFELKAFSREAANKLLKRYKLKPRPIVVKCVEKN